MADKVVTEPITVPVYSFTLGLEERFNYEESVKTLQDNWHIPFVLAVAFYLPVLYIGQNFMKNREPYNLRVPMMIWNSGLAIFSIMGFSRITPEFLHSLTNYGFQHSVCNNTYIHSKEARYWVFLFVISKIPELGDTFFLVLRKQKLIFLHVYHHATVMIFAWSVFTSSMAAARWFCSMNYGVHSIMYAYYVLKAMPDVIRVPKWVSMFITSLQTIQMILGAYAVGSSFRFMMAGKKCATTPLMITFGLLIYLSYLVLFAHFFYKSYCSPRPLKDRQNGSASSLSAKKKV